LGGILREECPEDVVACGRIMLKGFLKKKGRVSSGLTWLTFGKKVGSCAHGDELLVPLNKRNP
jgi:hypothetical protein